MEDLKYPEGSIISWCDEYYKVIEFAGEEAILIKDNDIIKKVNNWIDTTLIKE